MEGVYVAGVGMTPFGRLLDTSIKAMTKQAVDAALADADGSASPFSYWLIRRSGDPNPASVTLADWIREQAAMEGQELRDSVSGRAS